MQASVKPAAKTSIKRAPDERVNWKTSLPFIIVHLLPLVAIFTGVTWTAVILCFVLYYGRMFFLTAGYHRYFAHRSYKMGRPMQFVMAFGGTMCAQKGPLWWAGHHRDHHRYSDTPQDIHSPLKGFWWSHLGWILSDKYNEVDYDAKIRDFAKYPEIRWIDKYNFIGPWTLGIAAFLIGGLPGLFFGFFLSTVLLFHGTFLVNSLAHVMGRRRYATTDTSKNSALIALVTNGEGWHNNHHYYQASARQGFYWWEFDLSFYVIKLMSWVGLASDVKVPSAEKRAANHIKDGAFDVGIFQVQLMRAETTFENSGDKPGDERYAAIQRKLAESIESAQESASDLARTVTSRRRPATA